MIRGVWNQLSCAFQYITLHHHCANLHLSTRFSTNFESSLTTMRPSNSYSSNMPDFKQSIHHLKPAILHALKSLKIRNSMLNWQCKLLHTKKMTWVIWFDKFAHTVWTRSPNCQRNTRLTHEASRPKVLAWPSTDEWQPIQQLNGQSRKRTMRLGKGVYKEIELTGTQELPGYLLSATHLVRKSASNWHGHFRD